MADFYNVHLRKTTDPVPILWSKLERGMVVNMTYRKKTGTQKYVIFVLQPKWPNDNSGKLHALSFNSIKLGKVLELGEYYKEVLSESKKVRKLDITKIKLDTASKLFYTSEIKNDSNLKAGYRTFDIASIQKLFAVNYDWGQYDKIPPAAERERLLQEQKDKLNENKLRNSGM